VKAATESHAPRAQALSGETTVKVFGGVPTGRAFSPEQATHGH